MTFQEALRIMVHGRTVSRLGKLYKFERAIYDVTNPKDPVLTSMTKDFLKATDWVIV